MTAPVRGGVRRALAGRLLALATALVVAVGLAAQLAATAGRDSGYFDSDASRVANVFAYFTIQSNVLVLVTCAALALRRCARGPPGSYPFLDVDDLGYPRVLLNAVLVSALFLALAVGARWADHRLPGGR